MTVNFDGTEELRWQDVDLEDVMESTGCFGRKKAMAEHSRQEAERLKLEFELAFQDMVITDLEDDLEAEKRKKEKLELEMQEMKKIAVISVLVAFVASVVWLMYPEM